MSQAQLNDYMAKLKAETKIKARDQIINSLIAIVVGASLVYWAYGRYLTWSCSRSSYLLSSP